MKLYFPLTEEEVRKMDEEYFIKQGIEKGIEKGIEQGIEKGLEQGLKQGSLEKQKEMVLKMYQENIPIKTIAKISSLSISEVEEIINKKA